MDTFSVLDCALYFLPSDVYESCGSANQKRTILECGETEETTTRQTRQVRYVCQQII